MILNTTATSPITHLHEQWLKTFIDHLPHPPIFLQLQPLSTPRHRSSTATLVKTLKYVSASYRPVSSNPLIGLDQLPFQIVTGPDQLIFAAEHHGVP